MNIHMQTTGDVRSHSVIAKLLLLTGPLVLTTTSASAGESYFHRMLFDPTDSMLQAEANGSIMIYDGLDSVTVDKFMNEQFDRIDSAMFVRIHHLQDSGEYLVEDDNCD